MITENPTSKMNRYSPLDLLRGLLMIFMALDHANFHIAQQHSSGEYWGGYFPVFQNPLHFLTRFLTHFSAPGFFFLMGTGMVLFTSSRIAKGWNIGQVRWHFLLRGLVLIGLQIALNFSQAWSVGGSPALLWYVGVLAALGFGMVITIPLIELKPLYLAGISLGFFIFMEVLTPEPALWGQNFDNLAGTLLIYTGGKGEFWSNYPLLAWIEFVVLGLMFGRLIRMDSEKAYRYGFWLGGIFISGFVVLRMANGFGNIRPLASGTWMGFLSVVKYPPSMTFTLLTLGVILILIGVISRSKSPERAGWNPLLVFGRVPLFFYLTHIYLYQFFGRVFAPEGSNLGLMYGLWLGGLAVLYFPSYWYGQYKSRQHTRSWVRFL